MKKKISLAILGVLLVAGISVSQSLVKMANLAITLSTIDSTVIGGTTPAAATVSSLKNTTLAGTSGAAVCTTDTLGTTGFCGGSSTFKVQGVQQTTIGCTTAGTAYAPCTVSITWPVAFADSSYAVSCTTNAPSALTLGGFWWTSKTSTGLSVVFQNADASGANAVTVTEIDCTGVHN